MDATRTQELAAEEEAERQRKRAREKEAWRAQRERSAKKTAALQGHDEAWGRARVAHVGRAHSVAGALDAHIERHWRPSGGAFAYYPEGLLRIPERFVAVHVSRVIPLLVHCVEAEFDYAYATTAFCDEFLGEGRYARRVAQLPAAPPSLPLLERLSSATFKAFDEALCAAATHLYKAGVTDPFENLEFWRVIKTGALRVVLEKRATAEGGWELSGARRKSGPDAFRSGNRVMRRQEPSTDGGISRRRFSSDEDGDGPFEAAAEGVASAKTALRACLLQHEAQASALDDHWQLCCGVSAEDGAVRLADALAGEMPGSAEAFAKEDERFFGPPTRDAMAFAGGVRAQLRSSWPKETLPDNEARVLQWEATYESEATGRRERNGVCSRSFPLLARALEDKHNPPLGCEDCQWRAADLDATGDCMIAACAWQLRKLLPESVLVSHGLLTMRQAWDAKRASDRLRRAGDPTTVRKLLLSVHRAGFSPGAPMDDTRDLSDFILG
ncbi:hypothetical protein EMIHUDRAFT_250891, partial [Emiliania huxleyi CCMP1516]|uniref:Uncharacterized protein n=2 Tax=Emiliania huxleyi TaxID=2903 RepID=A0A0D3KZC0_EMIH1